LSQTEDLSLRAYCTAKFIVEVTSPTNAH